MSEDSAVRVLHVLGKMDRGGVETWLMHVFRHIDRARFQMSVLVHTQEPGAFDPEVESLGIPIIPCPSTSRPLEYARRFLDVLRRGPGYDVVHSHVHHFSAYPLGLAKYAGVPVRVAHSHNDTSGLQRSARFPRRMYFHATRRALASVPTDRLAASRQAGQALFGPGWPRDAQDRVLHYGIDLAPFQGDVDAARIRQELGLPPTAFVIGHVGRFVEQKNHAFLIDVMAEVAKRDPDALLLLVGVGPLRTRIEDLVRARGLTGRVVFAGARSDVVAVMRGVMDVFALPSLHEGLGIVGIEAQGAGLPCLLSTSTPPEVAVVPDLVQFLPLAGGVSGWADAILASKGRAKQPGTAWKQLQDGPYDIRTCLDALGAVYTHRAGAADIRPRSVDGAGVA